VRHRPLDAAIDSAGLQGLFELRLSTDTIRTYKPDPRAYQLGVDAFGLGVDEIGFVASRPGGDAAGARAFGHRTFWVNRANQPVEELGARPDAIGTDLTGPSRVRPSRDLSAPNRSPVPVFPTDVISSTPGPARRDTR
jgi:beta-phosphoglucomutase-like phosphatase (HAD superfamily)